MSDIRQIAESLAHEARMMDYCATHALNAEHREDWDAVDYYAVTALGHASRFMREIEAAIRRQAGADR